MGENFAVFADFWWTLKVFTTDFISAILRANIILHEPPYITITFNEPQNFLPVIVVYGIYVYTYSTRLHYKTNFNEAFKSSMVQPHHFMIQ